MPIPVTAPTPIARLLSARVRAAARHLWDLVAFGVLWAAIVATMGAAFLTVFGPLRKTADRPGYAFANEDLLTDLIYGGLLREVAFEVTYVARTIGAPSPWEAIGITLSAAGLWFAWRDNRDAGTAAVER